MTERINVAVDGRICPVTVSDENKALLAAKAAGGAIVGILGENSGERAEDTAGFDACLYLVMCREDVTEELLERAARRHLGLPWRIAETPRLRIREFADRDPLEEKNPWDCGVFAEEETRRAYIGHQYRFAEYGLWALEEKAGGAVAGKAGITDVQEAVPGAGAGITDAKIYMLSFAGASPENGFGELGYHIYPEFRGMGLAEEACRAVISYAEESMALAGVYLRIRGENPASEALARKLGFLCISPGKS